MLILRSIWRAIAKRFGLVQYLGEPGNTWRSHGGVMKSWACPTLTFILILWRAPWPSPPPALPSPTRGEAIGIRDSGTSWIAHWRNKKRDLDPTTAEGQSQLFTSPVSQCPLESHRQAVFARPPPDGGTPTCRDSTCRCHPDLNHARDTGHRNSRPEHRAIQESGRLGSFLPIRRAIALRVLLPFCRTPPPDDPKS